MTDKQLTNQYYTRYHIWQALIKQAGELPAESIANLAEEGYAFIWGEGDDVMEDKPVKEEGPPGFTITDGGAYL